MDVHVDRHPARAANPAAAPLLLLHGLGGDRHSWRPVLDGLRAEREVLVAELPGFGASPPLPAPLEPTPRALARSIAAALDQLGVDRPHVAGVSLGGWTALELALLGHARSVVALAPAGFWSRPLDPSSGGARRAGRRAAPLLPLLLSLPPLRARVLGGVLGGPGRFGRADALALVRGYVAAPDFERVDAAMRANVFARDQLAELAARLPVHLVWCGRDRLVTPPRAPLPAAVHQHRLAEAGHLPMFDDPAAVIGLVAAATAAADRAPLPDPVGER
ncbi:alpha/beta fold hydrolase [Patulibacter defluvii]|uniref:alpha/beta fold hydrolase n=1 Tax=Patulibacter defluvii TaxID=3095358 RepID=UPI002A760722|nr:alpha/beta fold hydrolase [Patulibacter sp. DM4]